MVVKLEMNTTMNSGMLTHNKLFLGFKPITCKISPKSFYIIFA